MVSNAMFRSSFDLLQSPRMLSWLCPRLRCLSTHGGGPVEAVTHWNIRSRDDLAVALSMSMRPRQPDSTLIALLRIVGRIRWI